jgi:hypothetical protein
MGNTCDRLVLPGQDLTGGCHGRTEEEDLVIISIYVKYKCNSFRITTQPSSGGQLHALLTDRSQGRIPPVKQMFYHFMFYI